jgi:PAS domain S-box-containing protein
MIFVSPASLDLLGAHPIELLGDHRRWLSRVHPDDQEVLLAAVARLTRQREPVACEYRIASLESGPPLGPDDPVHSTRSALRGALAPPGSKRPSGLIPRRHPRWVRHTLAPQYSPAGELVGWDGIVSDITEQRVLADDLRRTTTMFDALVANLPAGVFFVQGEAGLPILLNARARQLLGQAEQLDVGLNRLVEVYRLHRPDGSPYPTDELPVVTALRSGTTSMRDDIVVHRPDGGLVPLITWAAPIHLGGEGRPDAAVWVFEDLTALKQAEAARRESEARLRTVIETMAEGVIILDERSVILECNPAACAILGRDAAGLRGRSLLEPEWQGLQEDGTPLPPEEHPAVVSRRLGRAVRNVIMGLTGTAAGAVRWLLASAVPLPRETGPGLAQPTPVRRVLMTFADITAYRQALDTVRASEEKNRVLVETLPIMLVQFDRGGQLTYMNPAAQRVSGYGPEDLQGAAAWETLIHPDDLPAAREAFAKALAEDTVRFEIRYWAKDGSEKVGYVLMEPRYHDGQVAGTTHLIVDMTRERQLEQELQRTQRLELIGRLASGMTHDFNNLLTVILTLAELARTSLPDDHPVRDDLHRIALAGEQAANLAHQLLAFCKNRRATPHRIDVNRVARRALELLQATLPRSIHIEPQLAQEELPILADEMQLQQVLINLCLNARDAMPHGGRLILRSERAAPPRHSVQAASGNGSGSGHDAERTTASGNGEGESALWVRLAVEDEGHGIPDDVRARIFDPFFSTKEHGTGLGLAMVRQIVEGCGGWVEVWSRPGEGSRFDVWLPPAPADEPAPVPGKVMV